MKSVKIFLLLLFAVSSSIRAQSSFAQQGYLSNISSFTFNSDLIQDIGIPNNYADQQLQLRLNNKYYYNNHIRLKLDIRNRLFSGYQWQTFSEQITSKTKDDNLSFYSIQTGSFALHHHIDRLYFEWEKNKLNIRIGRQRVNWGIQNFWNPHDLFNQSNFFDFDYPEKPGNDLIRLQYFHKLNSSIELAINEEVQAMLYKFNYVNYDFQIITAKYSDDYVAGLGWAGQIKNIGFKGEFASFINQFDAKNTFTGGVNLDYSFKSGLYISAGYLFNSNTSEFVMLNFTEFNSSAKSAMPFKHNYLYQLNYSLHPLVLLSTSVIHDGDFKFAFLSPQLSYSLFESVDLSLSYQTYWAEVFSSFEELNKILYTRLQWSF